MDKNLENIYREEFIRQKAKYDFERNLKNKKEIVNPTKNNLFALLNVSIPILWGIISFYLLFKISSIFI